MAIGQKNLDKFPIFLRSKLESGEVTLPEGVEFDYEDIVAYRALARNTDDFTPLNSDDMKSYAELGKFPRGLNLTENDAKRYGVSLYTNKDCLQNLFRFPNPKKKLAKGMVCMTYGPQLTERFHVNWWLYSNAKFDSFEICED